MSPSFWIKNSGSGNCKNIPGYRNCLTHIKCSTRSSLSERLTANSAPRLLRPQGIQKLGEVSG